MYTYTSTTTRLANGPEYKTYDGNANNKWGEFRNVIPNKFKIDQEVFYWDDDSKSIKKEKIGDIRYNIVGTANAGSLKIAIEYKILFAGGYTWVCETKIKEKAEDFVG